MSSSSTTTPPAVAPVPKPPQPLYPDVPWWAVLITAFVFSVVGVVVGVFALKDGLSGASGPSLSSSLIADTVAYIPHILLLFGVLADMFTLDGVWSIPSLVGILSIFANYVFQYFWKGIDELVATGKNTVAKATSTPPQAGGADLFVNYKGCTVQGFDSFASDYAPQTLVVTSTVFSYYCFDLIRNRGWINSIAAIMAFFVAYFGEVAVISFQNPNGCGTAGMGVIASSIRALFEGALFGGVSYGIVQTYAPTRLPSSTISPFPRKTARDLSPGPDGKMYDENGFPYVVLPNGQAVPDMSSAAAQSAFGGIAGGAAGDTTPLGSNCPGSKAPCPGP